MQEAAFFYYIACLVVGLSSIIALFAIAAANRDALLGRSIPFYVFFSVLIASFTASVYIEANHPAAFASISEYLRIVVFFAKCGLSYSLVSLVNAVFEVRNRRFIDYAVLIFLGCAAAMRLAFYSGIFPDSHTEASPFLPVSRIAVDAAVALSLIYLVSMRVLRITAIKPSRYRELMKLNTIIIACFAPFVIFELLFYRRWGLAVFSPAMYSAVCVATVIKVSARNARAEAPVQDIGASLHDFIEAYGMTNREADVLERLIAGRANREIADELCVSLSTVKAHVYSIFKKARVKTRHQLFVLAMNHRSIPKS